jgi:hypothetical protein
VSHVALQAFMLEAFLCFFNFTTNFFLFMIIPENRGFVTINCMKSLPINLDSFNRRYSNFTNGNIYKVTNKSSIVKLLCTIDVAYSLGVMPKVLTIVKKMDFLVLVLLLKMAILLRNAKSYFLSMV